MLVLQKRCALIKLPHTSYRDHSHLHQRQLERKEKRSKVKFLLIEGQNWIWSDVLWVLWNPWDAFECTYQDLKRPGWIFPDVIVVVQATDVTYVETVKKLLSLYHWQISLCDIIVMVLAIIVSEYPTFTHSFVLVYIFVSTFFLGKLVWTGRLCSRMLIKISHLSAKSHFSPLANIDKRKIPLTNELLRFAPVLTLIFIFLGGEGSPLTSLIKTCCHP